MNEILEHKGKPSTCNLFQDTEVFLFQKNSAQCHIAIVYKKWFQDSHIPQLE